MGTCATKGSMAKTAEADSRRAVDLHSSSVDHMSTHSVDTRNGGVHNKQHTGTGTGTGTGGKESQPVGEKEDNEVDSDEDEEWSDGTDSWASSAADGATGEKRKSEKKAKLMHLSSSKLHEQARRRLSVSTVEVDNEAGQIIGATHEALVAVHRANSSTTAGGSSSTTTAGTIPIPGTQPRKRSLILKYSDPALHLVDERRGAIKDVTVKTLLELIPDADITLAHFGAPCWDMQKGFENKDCHMQGTLAGRAQLADFGIGSSCKKGLKPESPNQDDYFVFKIDDWAIYGVFDGHGPCGHDVSSFVHTTLPFLIISDPQFEEDPSATLRRAFRKVHHLLEASAQQADAYFDCTLSGTTGTVVVHKDEKLYVAHVGDSRAVLAKRCATAKKHTAVELTRDHKPTIEEEKTRIETYGGEVRRLEGDIPYRVFVKNRMYPGLAMSRAIGDSVGSAVGVISDPDLLVVDLTGEDDFIVIATDGVWEFVSSQEAVDFCAKKSKKDVQDAAEHLAYESWRRWVEEEENVVDDVTCLVIHLNSDLQPPPSPVAATHKTKTRKV
eukprot:Lankesteria_metandrocarpae@DN4318_c0_g1_i1.p1